MEIGKEFLEKVIEMTAPAVLDVNGRKMVVRSSGDTEDITPDPVFAPTLELGSLEAMVKMVKTEAALKVDAPIYIEAKSPTRVECYEQHHEKDEMCLRPVRYIAKATDVPGWEEKVELPFEQAMIALRTRFQATPDTEYALKLLSDITTGSKITYNDNGVATSIVTKRGVDLQANASIRPIITLRPYRTFQEVEQPASEFLIRVNERGIAFIEADGGMWKLAARKTIKAYFEEQFEKEIKDGKVVVML